jgi:hypothetical protein
LNARITNQLKRSFIMAQANVRKKSNAVASYSFDEAIGLLALSIIGAGSLTFDVRKLAGPEAYDRLTANGKNAIGHGMVQKLMDRAAIGRDQKTGKSATPAEKFEAIKALADHLANGGEWRMKGGGPRPLDRTALYLAVAVVRGVAAAKVESAYRSKADEVLRTLLAISAIAAKYAELTARGDSESGESLLDELDEE